MPADLRASRFPLHDRRVAVPAVSPDGYSFSRGLTPYEAQYRAEIVRRRVETNFDTLRNRRREYNLATVYFL